jgi:hypothetical protein
MLVRVFEHAQWRWALSDRPAPRLSPRPARCFWPLIQLGVYGFVPVRSLKLHRGFWGKYLIIQPLIQLLIQLSIQIRTEKPSDRESYADKFQNLGQL